MFDPGSTGEFVCKAIATLCFGFLVFCCLVKFGRWPDARNPATDEPKEE